MQHRRSHLHQHANIGEKIADKTAASIGSWNFIIAQAALMAVWFFLNTAGWFIWKWDLYPFVFLNLAMSAEAAFSAPIIMMSQNRQADKDRKRDDLEAKEVDDLYSINTTQLEILKQQSEILELLRELLPESRNVKIDQARYRRMRGGASNG